ncbi:DUF1214 domain-containing protein, partial [Nocardia cyriacigeorgica]|uniref:DUF1214 domain-containing protein n=1 Tax=Nocardia cyriacigeorgica TaxID=135487 RepID=UPI0028124617
MASGRNRGSAGRWCRRRRVRTGSEGRRDADGAYLDGAGYYSLTVPQPVPARLFWSITAYDASSRSE